MEPITISREELYRLVWETPTKHLCKQFGLSDVGLAKTCKRHEIPKPPPGYWSMKKHGWGVRQTPLPKCSDPKLEKIEFRQDEVPKEEPSQFFDPEIEALYEAELKATPITVATSLRGAHSLVSRMNDRLNAAKPSSYGNDKGVLHADQRDDEWRLAVSVSKPLVRRAMLIVDALLKGLEKRGYVIKKREHDWTKSTTVVGHGHEFGLRLREPTKRSIRGLTEKETEYRKQYPSAYHRTEYDYHLTGELQLEVSGFPGWAPKLLRDGKKRLEERLAGLPAEMLKAIDAERKQVAKRAEEERQRQEAARLRAEEQARLQRKQARLKRRRERDAALLQMADLWQRCDTLRRFIETVRQVAVEEIGSPENDPKIARWLAWAERVAARQDPLSRLRRSSPKRPR